MRRFRFRTLAFLTCCVIGVFGLSPAALHAAVPRGWHLAGSYPQEYEVGTRLERAGPPHSIAYLRSATESPHGFGTIMQSISAEHYAGHRVRLSADVKSDHLSAWAGLWMRADKDMKPVVFDNMQNRAIHGTQDWQHYEVVLDIPEDATSVHFGALLVGAGEIEMSDFKLDVLPDPRIPQIGPPPITQSRPVNLDLQP
jgi:hypothetical protein